MPIPNISSTINSGFTNISQGINQLDSQEKEKVEELKQRDAEVKRHEQAHVRVAGRYVKGMPHYGYVTGPDHKRYAVDGEVRIDTSEVPNNPEATVRKAQTVRRSALAPTHPSGQDRRVAAQASRMEQEARQDVREKRTEEMEERAKKMKDTVGTDINEKSHQLRRQFDDEGRINHRIAIRAYQSEQKARQEFTKEGTQDNKELPEPQGQISFVSRL